MAERSFLLTLAILGASAAAIAVRAWAGRRSRRLRLADPVSFWSALGVQPDGRPTLVVFSTPSCVACRAAQEPAVQWLSNELRDALRVVLVDISAQPGPARAFKVLTAPSSAVLRPDGRVVALNHGFASGQLLERQVRDAGGPQGSTPSLRRQSSPVREVPASASRR